MNTLENQELKTKLDQYYQAHEFDPRLSFNETVRTAQMNRRVVEETVPLSSLSKWVMGVSLSAAALLLLITLGPVGKEFSTSTLPEIAKQNDSEPTEVNSSQNEWEKRSKSDPETAQAIVVFRSSVNGLKVMESQWSLNEQSRTGESYEFN